MVLAECLEGRISGLGLLAVVQLAVFLWYGRMAEREFGGITGDLAGWFLQVCELASLAAFLVLGPMDILRL